MTGKMALVVTATLITISVSGSASEIQPLRVGDRLPSRTLPLLAGPSMTIPDDMKGKITVIHFFTDSCGSCREEMPALDRLYGLYQRKGLQVVAVNVGQTRKRVEKFVQETRISYPILLDLQKETSAVYTLVGLPRTYILDRKGVVRCKLIGSASEDALQKFLMDLL